MSQSDAMSRRRVIIDYLDATRNEIAIDEALLQLSGFQPDGVGQIPRAPKWVAHAKRHPKLLRIAAILGRLLWTSGGGVLFLLWEFIPRWLQGKNSVSVPRAAGYVLALSSRVGDIMSDKIVPDLPDTWVTMPWAPLARFPTTARLIDVFNLLSRRDLLEALKNALIAQRRLALDPANTGWALQGYTAFKWFAVRAAIDKLSGNLIMAEHFDRWAVLVDRSSRGRHARASNRQLTLVQHGAISGLDGRYAFHDLPTRLRSVIRLYVYGPEDEVIFRRCILAATYRQATLDVHYFKPHIELRPLPRDARLKLLFVGHPLCEALHVALFQAIRHRLQFAAFYKPHPLAPMSPAIAALEWQIITEPDHFPEVDLLISYPSTLVVEYAVLKIPAVVHALNAQSEDCRPIVQEILAHVPPAA